MSFGRDLQFEPRLHDIPPAWLTDADELDYETTEKREGLKGTEVSRKSVAAYVVRLLREPGLRVRAGVGLHRAARYLPTVRSCISTPNSAASRRFRSARRQRTTPSRTGTSTFEDRSDHMVAGSSVTAHVAAHIIVMNVAAPIVAIAWARYRGGAAVAARQAVPAAAVQLTLLCSWHAPQVLTWAGANPLAWAAMHVSLAAAAFWFWTAILSAAQRSPPCALACLLVTAKLFCLLAVLLVLSPRPLYPGHGAGSHSAELMMADQQLAGLIMLVACPVVYLLAATVIAARWLSDIERRPAALRS